MRSLEARVRLILVKVTVWLSELEQKEARVVSTSVEYADVFNSLHQVAFESAPRHQKLLTFVDLYTIYLGTRLTHILA